MTDVEDKPKNLSRSKTTDVSRTSSDLVRRGLDELQAFSIKRIRLLIVDGDPFTRYQLRQIIEPEKDIEVICEAGQALEGLYAYKELFPDVVIVNAFLGDLGGFRFSSFLCERYPEARILIYGIDPLCEEIKAHAKKSGAVDYAEIPPRSYDFCESIRIANQTLQSRIARIIPEDHFHYLFMYSSPLTLESELTHMQKGLHIPPISNLLSMGFHYSCIPVQFDATPVHFYKIIDSSRSSLLVVSLDFMFSDLTGHELSTLPFPYKLHTLNLLGTSVGVDGVDYAKHFDRIVRLLIRGTCINEEIISTILSHSSLKDLDMSSTRFTDIMVTCMKNEAPTHKRASLEILELENNLLTGEILDFIFYYPNLYYVSLRGNPITSDGIKNLVDVLSSLSDRQIRIDLELESISQVDFDLLRHFNHKNISTKEIFYRLNRPPFITSYHKNMYD